MLFVKFIHFASLVYGNLQALSEHMVHWLSLLKEFLQSFYWNFIIISIPIKISPLYSC